MNAERFQELCASFEDGEGAIEDIDISDLSATQQDEFFSRMALRPLWRDSVGERDGFAHRMQKSFEMEEAGDAFVAQFSSRMTRKRRTHFNSKWALAACLLLAGAALTVLGLTQGSWEKSDTGTDTFVRPPAQIIHELNVEGADSWCIEGHSLDAGEFSLSSGRVQLRYASGASILIKGPARFQIVSATEMILHEGSLRGLVPLAATGFIVGAPGVNYTDVGTEFGISVMGSKSELHVFDGEVRAKTHTSGLVQEVTIGEAVQSENERFLKIPMKESQFATVDALSLERWQVNQEKVLRDDDLLVLFSFDGMSRKEVTNLASSSVGNGVRKGVRPVSGRWPEKGAILFDRPGDWVELSVPGEYRNLTIATWLKIERFDFKAQSIVMSDHVPGSNPKHAPVRMMLSKLSQLWGKPYDDGNRFALRFRGQQHAIAQGVWSHLVMVVSLDAGTTSCYADGQLVWQAPVAQHNPPSALVPGKMRIGSWNLEQAQTEEVIWSPERGLRGRMDEFIMWRRALSEEEIRTLSRIGPSEP